MWRSTLLLFLASTASAFMVGSGPSFVAPATRSIRSTASFSTTTLFGILDEMESDSYDLSSGTAEADTMDVKMNDSYEMFLADLVFSTNDPRVDILNQLEKSTDPEWLTWLEAKVASSTDPDERLALRDLLDMITELKTTVEVSKLAEERQAKEASEKEADRVKKAEQAAADGLKMSDADVLKKASEINAATSLDSDTMEEQKKTFYEQQLTPEIKMSYEALLKKVYPPYKAGDSYASIVNKFYEQFDAQFVKVLTEKAEMEDDEDAKQLLGELANAQQIKIVAATESLKQVLALGDPMRMEGAVIKMAREGKIDEPFLLLLEANEDQARAAGVDGAAEVMKRLRQKAAVEKDKQASSKEIRLIRQLLRTDNATARELLLEEAFTPRDVLIVAGTAENARKAVDGEQPEEQKPMPDVPPPDFINACKAVLLNFGNLGGGDSGDTDLATRIKLIASEAEVVATRIFGKGMSLREQQDRAWSEQTTSIFDLEQMELEAMSEGESAPWTNPDAPDDMIPGFDASGRMRIGGS